mgnify:CR=1 FL=1
MFSITWQEVTTMHVLGDLLCRSIQPASAQDKWAILKIRWKNIGFRDCGFKEGLSYLGEIVGFEQIFTIIADFLAFSDLKKFFSCM